MANLKSGNVLVRILLIHGEKIGMFAVVVCAGLLFWSALNSEQLGDDLQPEQLVSLADSANRNVLGTSWNDLDPNTQLRPVPLSSKAMTEVARIHFPPLSKGMDEPVLDPVSLRTDPALVTLEDLEVLGGSGLWASATKEIIKKNQLAQARAREREKKRIEQERERERRLGGEAGGRGGSGRPVGLQAGGGRRAGPSQ